MSFSFDQVEEAKQTKGTKISTGVHEVKIKEVKVEEVKGKDGNPDWKKGMVVFEATKTIQGKDSVGKTIDYQITMPKDPSEVKAGNNNNKLSDGEKLGKRLFHIFNKISTTDKKDTVTATLKKLDLSSIDTLMAGLKKLAEGRSLRIKVIADQDGKYPMIPLYYAGYAETIDTNPSELVYDEAKEGTKTSPKGAEVVSNPTGVDDGDDLPF